MQLRRVLFNIISVWLLVMAMSVSSFAQWTGKEVMIYCRDGAIYKGKLISKDPEGLDVVLFMSDTIRVPTSIIKKVRQEGEYIFLPYGRAHDIHGFFWAASLGFNAASFFGEDADNVSSHLELLFGYRANKQLSLAAGFGSEFNGSTTGGFYIETQFTSLYVYGRYYLTDGRRRLFTYSRLGYGFGHQDDFANLNHSGGVQWQGGGGIHFASRKRSRFILSLGYYLQKTKGTQFYLDNFSNEIKLDFDLLIGRPILKLGVEFR